jgi:hypothetical protein
MDFNNAEALEPMEMGEEMLDLVSGGVAPRWDPSG